MTKNDYMRLAGGMRAELNRARLSERQAVVAEALVKATFARGRACVRIPRLDDLAGALGFSRGNVHEALFGRRVGGADSGEKAVYAEGLQPYGILRAVRLETGGGEYRLLPDSRQWAVGWRYKLDQLQAFLHGLDLVSGQVQRELLEPEPDLAGALAEVSLENALAGEKAPVPESGTGFPAQTAIAGGGVYSSNSNRVLDDKEYLNRSNIESSARARGWLGDGYLVQKLQRQPVLEQELRLGATPMAQHFTALWLRNGQRARELVSMAVTKRSPGAWLNTVLVNEGASRPGAL